VLTTAFLAALRLRAPGFQFFARVLAFAPEQFSIGSAVVWLIEPTTIGNTASALFREVLRDNTERDQLMILFQWAVNGIAENPVPKRMRQLARQGSPGDVNHVDVARATLCLEALI
jgi:hypothetical protein